MSLAARLRELQEQRRRELALVRSRMTALADSLEHEGSPAQWVRAHPYVATAGAAAIGFVAAQLPGKSSRPAPPPPPPAPPAPPAAAVQSPIYADVLALLVRLAEGFLQPPPESPPASLTVADAGAIADPAFRRPFSAPAEGPPTEAP
jgi:hypothetical protein